MPSEKNLLMMGKAVTRSGQPKPALECLCGAYEEIVGFDLFTVTLLGQPTEAAQTIKSGYRVYSTMMETHPAVVEVPFDNAEWADAMIVKKHNLVMNTVEQYRRYYDAWALLQRAGLHSAVNIPVVVNDTAIGTINMMSRFESYFNAERLAATEQLHAVSALTLMLCREFQSVLPRF
jgi:transcriptional regulator with GAF, ATPase, and Fis domain